MADDNLSVTWLLNTRSLQAPLPDVDELLAESIDEVESEADQKDGSLVAPTSTLVFLFPLRFFICDLHYQVLIVCQVHLVVLTQ